MSCATVRVGASCMLFMLSTGRVVVGVVGRPRVFPVRMPSGERYWTLLDDDLEPVVATDEFLRHLRFGRDAAESTTRTYAGGIALFLQWCALTGRDWRTAAGYLGMFMLWLRHAETGGDVVVSGPGTKAVRGPRRVNTVLAAVREFLKHQVIAGSIDAHVMSQLYRVADQRHLPAEARGESTGLRYYAKARHRLDEPVQPVDRATDAEVLGLLRACRSARDRLIVLLMARAGLRRGEVVGLRRGDLHFVVDATGLGCPVQGAHLHVVRRDSVNGAWAKSRRSRMVPVDSLVVQANDDYVAERHRCRRARDSAFVLVNLFGEPVGEAMVPGAINELLQRLSRRAELDRPVHPHMLRHGFGSSVMEAGATLDEAQRLLGHVSISSTQV